MFPPITHCSSQHCIPRRSNFSYSHFCPKLPLPRKSELVCQAQVQRGDWGKGQAHCYPFHAQTFYICQPSPASTYIPPSFPLPLQLKQTNKQKKIEGSLIFGERGLSFLKEPTYSFSPTMAPHIHKVFNLSTMCLLLGKPPPKGRSF